MYDINMFIIYTNSIIIYNEISHVLLIEDSSYEITLMIFILNFIISIFF